MNANQLVQTLQSEITLSAGCTDPGCISLATASAVQTLGRPAERMTLWVSGNLLKNAISVGIPEAGLSILSGVTPELLSQADEILARGAVDIQWEEHAPDTLYVRAQVWAGEDTAWAVIQGDYTHVIQLGKNDAVLLDKPASAAGDRPAAALLQYPVRELWDLILSCDAELFAPFLQDAETNKAAALAGIGSPETRLGPILSREELKDASPCTCAASHARTFTAAAGEARMRGLNVPIMTIAGSGNHGITNFLGVL